MTTRPAPADHLDHAALPVQAKLAAAWTSFMLLYVYVDYFHLYKPGTIDGISNGVVFEFDISPALMTGFLALIAIPSLMVMLSMTLRPRANRAVNLIVASLYVPVTVFNAVGESWEWAAFYALSIGLELAILAVILRSAWGWPRAATGATGATNRRPAGALQEG